METELVDTEQRTLELLLDGDVWEQRMGLHDFAPTAELLAGLQSMVSQRSGWDNVVQRALAKGANVRRVDERQLLLTLPQFAAYEIDFPARALCEALELRSAYDACCQRLWRIIHAAAHRRHASIPAACRRRSRCPSPLPPCSHGSLRRSPRRW